MRNNTSLRGEKLSKEFFIFYKKKLVRGEATGTGKSRAERSAVKALVTRA
jgi:hypothetical protein